MVLGSMLALTKLKISLLLIDLRKECDEGARGQWMRPKEVWDIYFSVGSATLTSCVSLGRSLALELSSCTNEMREWD